MNGFNNIIKLWTMYGFNYDNDFIEKVFSDEGEMMVQHLKWKFTEAKNIAGAYGAFFYFWSMIDTKCKNKLETWVLDNYKCD